MSKTQIPLARKLLGHVVDDLIRNQQHGFATRISNALVLMTRHPRKLKVPRNKWFDAAAKSRVLQQLAYEDTLDTGERHTDAEIAVAAGLTPEAAGRVSEVRNKVR